MSHGDGPPPIFEGDDFPYWKIRMEAYLEALDVGILRAASQGFPTPKNAAQLQGDEVNYEKWNAKARNTIFRGLCKDVTTREQTLERCPNLALASAFFAPGTKGPFSPGW